MGLVWLRGLDLNQRPSGYEPDELPGCSTPRHHDVFEKIDNRLRPQETDEDRVQSARYATVIFLR